MSTWGEEEIEKDRADTHAGKKNNRLKQKKNKNTKSTKQNKKRTDRHLVPNIHLRRKPTLQGGHCRDDGMVLHIGDGANLHLVAVPTHDGTIPDGDLLFKRIEMRCVCVCV